MSVREVYDNPGSFEVRLVKNTPPEILNAISELDHLVIHAQGQSDAHLQRYTDATLLSEARYAGPILQIDFEDDPFIIRGAGMIWHLGDSLEHAPIMAVERSFSAASLSTVLDDYTDGGIIPFGLTQGTITNPAGTFTGTFYPNDKALDSFRTVMKQLSCHYRVNPDGTVDAGPDSSNEVYLVDESDGGKLAVAIRSGWGSDPLRESVESLRVRVSKDATRWVSRAVAVEFGYDGTPTIGALLNRSVNPYYDIRNNQLVRNRVVSQPSSDSSIDITEFLTSELEQANLDESMDLDMSQWELADGQIAVGDFLYVYDPESGVFDTDNEIQHRGRRIYPKRIRILEGDWPLTKGMGVYVRPGGASVTAADWVDVSPYVEWERVP